MTRRGQFRMSFDTLPAHPTADSFHTADAAVVLPSPAASVPRRLTPIVAGAFDIAFGCSVVQLPTFAKSWLLGP